MPDLDDLPPEWIEESIESLELRREVAPAECRLDTLRPRCPRFYRGRL